MIRVNCERMIDISSEIEVVNDWVGKDEIIELLKLQINQFKCEVAYMKNEMDEKNFQIRSLLIQESKYLADVYDSNENNNNLNNLFNSTEISSTTNSNLSTHLSTHLSSTTSIIEPNERSTYFTNATISQYRGQVKTTIGKYSIGKTSLL